MKDQSPSPSPSAPEQPTHHRTPSWYFHVILGALLLIAIALRIWVIGTYYIGSDACTPPGFSPSSILMVQRHWSSGLRIGDLIVFEYIDRDGSTRVSPGTVLRHHEDADSLSVATCQDTLSLPHRSIRGRVVISLH